MRSGLNQVTKDTATSYEYSKQNYRYKVLTFRVKLLLQERYSLQLQLVHHTIKETATSNEYLSRDVNARTFLHQEAANPAKTSGLAAS